METPKEVVRRGLMRLFGRATVGGLLAVRQAAPEVIEKLVKESINVVLQGAELETPSELPLSTGRKGGQRVFSHYAKRRS